MHLNYVTLFDSYYLDRGMILIESLLRHATDYTLYVFAFDDAAYDYLTKRNLSNVIVLNEKSLLDDKLEEIKKQRTRAEYCWTCTSLSISYVMNKLGEDNCTYIDSDMYFWDDPRVLVNELLEAEKNVLIVPHYFEDGVKTRILKRLYGNFCVEFNTFIGDEGRRVLDWWKNECLEDCFVNSPRGFYGDQKYLDLFSEQFECVHILSNRGGGVGPWNIGNYRLQSFNDEDIYFTYIHDHKKYKLNFVHYQGLSIDDEKVCLGFRKWAGNKYDKRLTDIVYSKYIRELIKAGEVLAIDDVRADKKKNNNDIQISKNEKAIQKSFYRTFLIRMLSLISYPRYIAFNDLDNVAISEYLKAGD